MTGRGPAPTRGCPARERGGTRRAGLAADRPACGEGRGGRGARASARLPQLRAGAGGPASAGLRHCPRRKVGLGGTAATPHLPRGSGTETGGLPVLHRSSSIPRGGGGGRRSRRAAAGPGPRRAAQRSPSPDLPQPAVPGAVGPPQAPGLRGGVGRDGGVRWPRGAAAAR